MKAECWHTNAKLRIPRPRKKVLDSNLDWVRTVPMPPYFSTDTDMGLYVTMIMTMMMSKITLMMEVFARLLISPLGKDSADAA